MNLIAKLKKAKGDENSMELYDVMQPIDFRNDRQVLTENIEYTLKREKLLPKGYSVIVPVGGIVDHSPESDRGTGHVQGDFELFAPDMNTIVAYGTAYGSIAMGELLDLTTEITQVTGEVGKPKHKSSKKRLPRVGKHSATLRGLRR